MLLRTTEQKVTLFISDNLYLLSIMTIGIPSSSLTITLPSSHHLYPYNMCLQLSVDFTMGPSDTVLLLCALLVMLLMERVIVVTTTVMFPTYLYVYIDKPRDFR